MQQLDFKPVQIATFCDEHIWRMWVACMPEKGDREFHGAAVGFAAAVA